MILRWYIDGSISRAKTWVGGSYKLEADYRPVKVNMSARGTGRFTLTIIDINDDGVSIFTNQANRPAMLPSQNDKTWTTIPEDVLREGSLVTLDIDSVCDETPIRDLTVEFVLEEV